MSECVDNLARTEAQLAKQAFELHEKHCDERMASLKETITNLSDSVNNLATASDASTRRLHGRLDALIRAALFGTLGIIGTALLGVIGWLVLSMIGVIGG